MLLLAKEERRKRREAKKQRRENQPKDKQTLGQARPKKIDKVIYDKVKIIKKYYFLNI